LHKPNIVSFKSNLLKMSTGTPSVSEVASVKETPEPGKPASAPAAAPPQRNTGRVPPGGRSTALW